MFFRRITCDCENNNNFYVQNRGINKHILKEPKANAYQEVLSEKLQDANYKPYNLKSVKCMERGNKY